MELAAVLWRFLREHESCLARNAGVAGFDIATTVPSSDPTRDAEHPLRRIVGSDVGVTRDRYEPLLARSGTPVADRKFDPGSTTRRATSTASRSYSSTTPGRPARTRRAPPRR